MSIEDIRAQGSRLTGGYHVSEDHVAVTRLRRLYSRAAEPTSVMRPTISWPGTIG